MLLLLLKCRRHHYKEDTLLLFVRLVHGGHASHKQMRSRRNEDANTAALRAQVKTLCNENQLNEALKMMEGTGIAIDFDTCAALVQACTNSQALAEGKQVHGHMCSGGLDQKPFLRAKLVNMYAICGSMMHAQQVFDDTPKRSVLLWNAMIKGYMRNEFYREALSLYNQMLQQQNERGRQPEPDNHTFSCVLKACSELSALKQGKVIHNNMLKMGFDFGTNLAGNALIAFYAKFGKTKDARQVFDKMVHRDVSLWNSMIAGYAQNGYYDEALELFHQMQMQLESVGMEPNMFTISSVLHSCAKLADVTYGKKIHQYIIKSGLQMDVFAATTLINMYANCNCVEISRQIFDKIPQKDVALWNAMLTGYAHSGNFSQSFSLFCEMQLSGLKPNPMTITSVLPVCGHWAVLQYGKAIHAYVLRQSFDANVIVGSALIDMYAKCGVIDIARQVFDRMSERDIVSWTAMIAGCGLHGRSQDVLGLLKRMENAGMKPDHITFIAVLSACSHAGLVSEGWHYFERMSCDNRITIGMEHYACMVDLLGRSGHLDEAYNFIKRMPLEPNAAVWGSLLGACRIHCNIELGQHVAEHLFELEPENEGYYILLSNIYAILRRWDDVAKVRIMMKDRGLKKKPGCSWIEVKDKGMNKVCVHAFVGGDKSHPESDKIYAMLESLFRQMRDMGYVPHINFVLDDVEDDKEKERILLSHSEKLAIAFGIIKTCPGMAIRITKNLRICGDCHIATKFISKIVGREIIVRDMNRFHCFKDGLCSCGDYW